MARRGRFLYLLLVVGLSAACLPDELELPPGGAGGSADTNDDGGQAGSAATNHDGGMGGSSQSSDDGPQGGGGSDAPGTISPDANATSDRTAPLMDAVSDGRPRDATDASTGRDVTNERPTPPRDAPTVSTDARADVNSEAPPTDDDSGVCVPQCGTVTNLLCGPNGCGGTCVCPTNMTCGLGGICVVL